MRIHRWAVALFVSLSILLPSSGEAAWPLNGLAVRSAPGEQTFWGPIVPDGSGGVIVPWIDDTGSAGPGTGLNIYALKMLPSGGPDPAWPSDGRALCTFAGTQDHLWSCPDGSGGAYVVWADQRDSLTTSGDIYATRVRSNGSIAAGWPANGLSICNAAGRQSAPVCANSSDGLVVGWYDRRVFGRLDLYAQRVDSMGVVRWADDGMPITTGMGIAGVLVNLAVMPDAVFSWIDYRTGSGDVRVQSLDSAGQPPPFVPDGVVVCTDPAMQTYSRAVRSGNFVYFAWQDERSGNSDVYGERVDLITLASWNSPNGLPIALGPGNQSIPQVIADGTGGAYFAWQDDRNAGSAPDVYVQHVTSAGSIAAGSWVANGIPVALDVAIQSFIELLPDGSGGAYLTWFVFGAPDIQFVATRLTSTGAAAAGWPATGRTAYTGPGVEFPSWACLDGADGLYMAWAGERDSTLGSDVYLQRLGPDGGPPTVDVPQLPLASSIALAAFPNPSRGAVDFAFDLAAAEAVGFDVLDVRGRLVRTLESRRLNAGRNHVAWDGLRASGSRAAAGIYWARLRTSAGERRVKVVLVR